MTKDKQFWDKMSKNYNKMFNSYKPYQNLYKFIQKSLTKDMEVLEVGTGTGLIAREISNKVKSVIATDFSEKMIEQAKQIKYASNVKFACADIFNLPYNNNSFDVVIASNILHIIPTPQKALQEISRVLKPEGILIAPTFLWKELTLLGRIQKFVMLRKKFPLQTIWDESSFIDFITNNDFSVIRAEKIKTSFAILCIEAKK